MKSKTANYQLIAQLGITPKVLADEILFATFAL
jgi:hypothetical protein